MRTYFGTETLLPIDVQPISLSIKIARKRSSGVTRGVEKIVVRIVVYSGWARGSIAQLKIVSLDQAGTRISMLGGNIRILWRSYS